MRKVKIAYLPPILILKYFEHLPNTGFSNPKKLCWNKLPKILHLIDWSDVNFEAATQVGI